MAAEGESREAPNQEKDKMQNDRDPLDQASQVMGGIHSHSRGDSGFLGPCFVAVFFFFGGGLELTISKVPSSIKISPCPGGERCLQTPR